jgi:hypothetical protein
LKGHQCRKEGIKHGRKDGREEKEER